jgi:HEAT repeat protein
MIGEPASLTVDGLLNCLADGDPAVRRAAVAALESIRPRSHAVIRALFKCLDSECEFDRWNARNAIIAVLRQLVPRGIQEQIDRLTLIPANSLSIREGIAAMLGSRPSWFEES